MPGFWLKKIQRKITNKLIKKVINPIEKSICRDIPCASTLQGEAPVKDTSRRPSPRPKSINPKHKNKNVEIFGFKFNGFFELHLVLGIFFIVKNIFFIVFIQS